MYFDLEWLYDTFIIQYWHIFSIILSAIMMYYVFLKARHSMLLYYYLILQGLLLLWMISKVLKTASPDITSKWIFILLQYGGVCFIGAAFFLFSWQYAFQKHLSLKWHLIIGIPPAISFIIIVTNPFHHMFYSSYDFLGDSFGPYFYIHSVILYLYLFAGIILCTRNFRENTGYGKIQARIISAAILIPILVNVLYIADVIEPRFDITPVTANISLLLFIYAIFKYRFLNVEPGFIQKALDSLDEGIILFDMEGRILEKNNAANKFFDILFPFNLLENHNDMNYIELSKNNQYYLVKKTRFESSNLKKQQAFYIVLIKDITEYKILHHQLLVSNKKLMENKIYLETAISKEKELQRTVLSDLLTKEAHDIIGHTFAVAGIMLDSLINNYSKQNTEKTYAQINEIIKILKGGYGELDNIGIKKIYPPQTPIFRLKTDIESLSKKLLFTNKKIETFITGGNSFIQTGLYNIIFRVCREAVTNTIKHSNADHIYILFTKNANSIVLNIIDNGSNISSFEKGNGLTGIEQRIVKAGGTVNFSIISEGGFLVKAVLPLNGRAFHNQF